MTNVSDVAPAGIHAALPSQERVSAEEYMVANPAYESGRSGRESDW
eukprot:CAMPEP_0204220332 /NCGR_PEP_ID=MMETSP0361-20130328/80871_1 /ASSEMBLY_ACC=CAM_ASM_000343 /TAXON_ID=268821 /ORGANISM="Scrippsiella Hangoei, Strain SHTV-5" /LENGTH=45 /DNA_ID= /DNA_START= /DNA_END= /DNA_ORIENTATION=